MPPMAAAAYPGGLAATPNKFRNLRDPIDDLLEYRQAPMPPARSTRPAITAPTTATAASEVAAMKKPETPKRRDVVPKPVAKQPCPSPPAVLKDKKSTVHFTKGRFLGEGGFARCYEVWDSTGTRSAAKVVPKATLKTDKSKQKLFTEIKIHQNLRHPNVVRFNHVFEDADNVYMILELCENQTLVDLLKKRRRLTEPEVQYYLAQLLDALRYMHSKRVIHRDLKLGNLFLTSDMVLKIGDFGLATVVKADGERKKTICGTPNYIAPEILFDQKHGHSFEVDIWSLGVIMYTLLVGRPPYQTKDVKAIYKNIRENKYEFPASVQLSPMAKDLISSMLTTRPDLRPTTSEARAHSWFNLGAIPKSMPVSALQMTPRFVLSPPKVKPYSPAVNALKVATPTASTTPSRKGSALMPKNMNTPVVSRTPLATIKHAVGGENVIPGLQALHIAPETVKKTPIGSAPLQITQTPISRTTAHGHLMPETPSAKTPADGRKPLQLSPPVNRVVGRKSMLEVMLGNLSLGLKAVKEGNVASACRLLSVDRCDAPAVFVSKWIDYSNKYGLGYQLTNGCVGVHFNDSTHIVLASNDLNFEYLQYARGTDKTVMNRHGHTLSSYPSELEKKVTLLTHFKSYMQENLFKAPQYSVQQQQSSNMDFLVKYMRTKHAVMFRLTNRLVQINFFDHTKLILSQDAKVVSYINRDREMTTMTLEQVLVAQKNEIISRLKYSRDILESLIHGRKDLKPAAEMMI